MADDSPSLYLITPVLSRADDFADALAGALAAAPAACVHLRLAAMGESECARLASRLVPVVQASGAAALLSDPRIAARAKADGAHVYGQGEALLGAIEDAVASLKPDRIVGAGGLRTRHDAMSAGELDIDYVAFGDPAPDGWTPDADFVVERVGWWSGIFNVPCVGHASSLLEVERLGLAGADFVALGDWMWSAQQGAASVAAEAAAILSRVAGRAS